MKRVIILAIAMFLISFASANSVVSANWVDADQDSTYSPPIAVKDDAFILRVNTLSNRLYCRYDTHKNEIFANMESFDENLETLHKKTFSGFTSSAVKRYYVKCIDVEYKNNGSGYPEPTSQLEIIVTVDPPISAKIIISDEYLIQGQHKVRLITTEVPLQEPELSYSYDGISYNKISLQGSEKEWIGYITISASEGEKIGSLKFSAKDLEGSTGEKIISGAIFKVDTKAPSSVNSIEAIGNYKQIKLEWSNLEEDIEYINIYRSTSPNVGLNDLYDEFDDPEEEEYIDESIVTGKTYYYKIAPVDKAGNKASLSVEVSASSRLDNSTSSSTGLSSGLFYLVDSVVTEIETLESEIESSKTSLNSYEKSEKELLEYTGVFDGIDSASSNLAALKREVVGYKLQDLTENLLNSKLEAARLRLNIIKKRIPQDAKILEESKLEYKTTQEDADILALEYSPDLTPSQINKLTRDAINLMEDSNFLVTSEIAIFDITNLDGTKSKQTVVTHSIPSSLERRDDYSIILKIPNSVNYEDITIENNGYQELSNYLLEFEPDTKKIAYTINDEIEPEVLEDIMISLVKHPQEQTTITGNSISNLASPGLGITILVLIAFSLVFYLFVLKKKHSDEEVTSFIAKAQEVKNLQKSGNHDEANKLYESLKLDYISLPQETKSKVFSKISHLHKKWNQK